MGSIATIISRACSALLLVAFITGPVEAGECKQPVYLTFDVGNMRHAEYMMSSA